MVVVFSSVFLIGIFTTSKANAQWATIDIPHIGVAVEKWIEDTARNFATNLWKNKGLILRKVLAAEIRKMLIEEGTFVTNWRNYQRKNQDAGAIIARGILGEAARGVDDDSATAVICEHLRESISDDYRAKRVDKEFAAISRAFRVNSDQTFKLSAKCTLPDKIIVDGVEKVFNLEEYNKNFEGGFAVFEKLLEPQNNAVGLRQLTENEFSKQRTAEESSKLNDAIAGNGFISLTNKNGQIKTPGKILQDSASSLIDSVLTCFENAENMTAVGICTNNLLVAQIKNFRNITDAVGLLDDDTANEEGGDAGEPTDEDPNVEDACTQLATDSAKLYCRSTVFGLVHDFPGQDDVDMNSEILKLEGELRTCLSQNDGLQATIICEPISVKLDVYKTALRNYYACVESQIPKYLERIDNCAGPDDQTTIP